MALPSEPTAAPVYLTPEEEELLAQQQMAAAAAAAVPPPAPAAIGAVQTTVPAQQPPPADMTYVPPPTDAAVPADQALNPIPYVEGQPRDFTPPAPAPAAAPVQQSALGATQTTVPSPAPTAPAPSTRYGGPDPNAPPLQGIVSTSYPASGRPPRTDVLSPTWKSQQRIGEGVDDWFAAPVERAPASAYDPADPALGGDRDRARTDRRPTAQVVESVPLPVSPGPAWATSPHIEDVSTWPEPSPLDSLRAWWQAQGLWPHYSSPFQTAIGRPLRGGGPPRSG